MPRRGELLRAAILLAALTSVRSDLPLDERIDLRPGAVYLRFLTYLGPHAFRFSSPAGRLLRLDVDQRGVDVAVLLFDPAGRLLYEVDERSGESGAEPVETVTPLAGDYRLVVEAAVPVPLRNQGCFALEIHDPQPATQRDRVHATAMTFLESAERRRFQHRPWDASKEYFAALPWLELAGESRRVAAAEWHLGQAYHQIGVLSAAATTLESAAVDYRRRYHGTGATRFEGPPSRKSCGIGEHDEGGLGEAWARNDLAEVELQLGRIDQALRAHQRALAVYRDERTAQNACACDEGIATTLTGIARLLIAKGEYQRAMDQLQEALHLWEPLVPLDSNAQAGRAITHQNLGSLDSLLGRDDEAFDELESAREDLKRSGKPDQKKQLEIMIAFGFAEYLAGNPEQALKAYDKAMNLARQEDDLLSEAAILDRRGSALKALGRYQEAAAAYNQARAISHAGHDALSEANTLGNLGWLDLEAGGADASLPGRQQQLEEASDLFKRALRLVSVIQDANAEVYALVGLSRAERLLRRFHEAQEAAKAAVDKVESLRASLRGPASRGTLLATRFSAYEELATLLMELDGREPGKGHAERALEVAERGRARGLIEALGSGKPTPAQKSLEAEVQQLSERREVIADANPEDPRLRGIDADLRRRAEELDQLTGAPLPGAGTASLTAADIRSLADESSLLIFYLLAEPESFAWTVDRQGVVAHRLPARGQIEELARRAAKGLADGGVTAAGEPVANTLQQLSQAVVAPLAARMHGKRNLVFLPDGALHLVPFCALPTPAPAGNHPGMGPSCLLDEHTVSILPSATLLHWQRRLLARRPVPPRIVAVLANPMPSQGFDALPFAENEAQAIARLVPSEERLVASGADATKQLVTSGALRNFRYLHFAVHGQLDPVLPERSRLILSPRLTQGLPLDRMLTAPEVAELDLPAELVVLSGCETSAGREIRGEGIVGLPHAFFRAGARRVIATRWSIRDRAAAEMMGHLYRGLVPDRLSAAEALRAAQQALRHSSKWRSPYFWAGYSLYGDWK